MKMKKTLFLAGLFLLLVAAVVTAQSSNETSESAPASTVTQRAVFQVENLTCGACFSKINSALIFFSCKELRNSDVAVEKLIVY